MESINGGSFDRKLPEGEDDGEGDQCSLFGIYATYVIDKAGGVASPSNWFDFASPVDGNPQNFMCQIGDNDGDHVLLDCHLGKSKVWKFLGYMREVSVIVDYEFPQLLTQHKQPKHNTPTTQEFDRATEQVMKHQWSGGCWDYEVWQAGRDCKFIRDCGYLGTNTGGTPVYAGPQPYKGGLRVGLFTDKYCLFPAPSSWGNPDDYGFENYQDDEDGDKGRNRHLDEYGDCQYRRELQGDEDGEDRDGEDRDRDGEDQGECSCTIPKYCEKPSNAVESNCDYKMTNWNMIIDTLHYCRSCSIYPTYQDGEAQEDLIDQCWKFVSHNARYCDADCFTMALAQGSFTEYHVNRFKNMDLGTSDTNLARTTVSLLAALGTLALSMYALGRVRKTRKPLDESSRNRKKNRKKNRKAVRSISAEAKRSLSRSLSRESKRERRGSGSVVSTNCGYDPPVLPGARFV